jgi:hypothetical protein
MFIYVYAILRWRAGSASEPGIGSYGLMLMFRLIAVLLAVSAVSLLIYAAMSDEDSDQMIRICWPVLVASLVFLLVQFVIGTTLGPADRFPEARRIFGGGLVAVTGMVTFAALVGLLVTVWEKTPDDPDGFQAKGHADRLKAFGAWLLCFGAVYLASAVRMARVVGARIARGPGGLTPP